ncbi:hypothetical protein PAXRUDRAFT_152858 [Paxillus rubicundulus Ve08.2h10]|uniref:Yeast cell wall synthesis Kre9/Knh1-like N-terminal domain-containing protein n=1 Tax=Paxillus rubicundulus Ve08.2h10 TaxID=930991 RepID=A0A0D0D796_9AGAM|nr:hypothetical protein PAXRUDRAFT_152858 [Paxillus rubicundulus Ve08.2h10]
MNARADPNPTNPGPGDVFIQGQPCTIAWDADSTGLWRNMTIELMTGDNFNMVDLTTVGTVDGTDPTKNTFSYTCPQVSPHSPIYFYQFTSSGSTGKTWTGRFTITDTPTNIVPPTESTQPDGSNIPWGTGSLIVGGSSILPQSTLSAISTALVGPPVSSTPSSSPASISASGSGAGSSSTPSVVVVTATATPSTASGQGTNGAMAMVSVSNLLWQTALALGVSAVGFTVMF